MSFSVTYSLRIKAEKTRHVFLRGQWTNWQFHSFLRRNGGLLLISSTIVICRNDGASLEPLELLSSIYTKKSAATLMAEMKKGRPPFAIQCAAKNSRMTD